MTGSGESSIPYVRGLTPRRRGRFRDSNLGPRVQTQALPPRCQGPPSVRSKSFLTTKHRWKLGFALDTGGLPGNGEQESVNDDGSNLGRTRLGRIVSAGGKELLKKLNSARKNFPMKIFLVLLGFYTANALATILGQTGDWDVLVAGIVVAAIEGIGMLMYRKIISS
ncbi:ycf20-like protein [Morus notabilis]|uniref:ycf20-like protein n=1 Tax=Morus notabilis TaxID=981085 RepID=UPI000CECE5D6|nr:ycf20-like protein [Morus notabilis]